MEGTNDFNEVPAWLETPPASAVALPVQTTAQELPVHQLRWDDFERLCLRLVRYEADIEHCQLYGTRGQEQHGIDIFGRHPGGTSYSLYQCKRVQTFGPAAIKEAVDLFLQGKWAQRATKFVLCLTDSTVRSQHADTIEEQAALLGKRGISLETWDRDRISELLKGHPELVDGFFGRAWTEAFCGAEVARKLGDRLDSFTVQTFRRDLGLFYRHVFDRQDPGIPIPRRIGSVAFSLRERYVLPDILARGGASAPKQILEDQAGDPHEEMSSSQSLTAWEAITGSEFRDPSSHKGLAARSSYVPREGVELWLSRAKRSIVIGGPGSGKSSLLRYLATDLFSDSPTLTKLAAKFGGLLPVWVPFAFWTKLISSGDRDSSLSDCVRRWLDEWNEGKVWPLVRAAIDDSRLLLLVDGLDEWTDEAAGRLACDRLQVFIEHRDVSAIVVSRPYGLTRMTGFGSGWQAGELASLSDAQRSELSAKWFRIRHSPDGHDDHPDDLPEVVKHDVSGFLAELSRSPDLNELSKVPFLLLLLLYLHFEQAVLPTSRFRAFDLMIDRLITEHPASRRAAASLGSSPKGLDDTELKRVLSRLAFEMQETRADGLISDDDLQGIVGSFLTSDTPGLGMDSSEARSLLSQFTQVAEGALGLLVRQATKQLSFFHRSFQEHLAALHIARLTLSEQRSFVERHFEDPRWREVLLSLFATRRPDELRILLETMKPGGAPESFFVAELRAEVGFGDFDCPTDLAKIIAEECFRAIEREAWLPHRRRLLDAALQGLHSRKTVEMVQKVVRRWVYSRHGWKPGWFAAMKNWPANSDTRNVLLNGLYNEDPQIERAAARTLAEVFQTDQGVGDLSAQVALKSPGAKLRAAAIEALGLGWPNHKFLDGIVADSRKSLSPEVRLAGIAIRIKRGIHEASDFNALLQMARRRNELEVDYGWRDEVANGLVDGWRGSPALKAKCLEAVRNPHDPRGDLLSSEVATGILLRAFPHDAEVANYCAELITNEEHPFIGIHDRVSPWALLREHFNGEPMVVGAIDSWLEKNKVDTMQGAFAALVGRTPKGKQVLVDTLTASFPHWSAWGLLEGWGMQDPEVAAALLEMSAGPVRSASLIGHLVPRIVSDTATARRRLLDILNDPMCVHHDFVVAGLASLADKGDVDEIVSACLDARTRSVGMVQESIDHYLIAHFPESPKVRELALQELDLRDSPVAACALAFARDSQMRARVAEIVQPLPSALRLRILQKVSSLPHDDEFSLSVLRDYDVEEDDELKTVASIAYHQRLHRQEDKDKASAELTQGISCYGPDHDERRRAAFAGLLVLERLELMRDLREKGGRPEYVSIDLGEWNQPNMPLVRLVAERWDYLKSVFGDSLPVRLSRWHQDCWSPLCRVAADFPVLQTEILATLEVDPKLASNPHLLAFVARVRPASRLLMDRCIAAIAAPNRNFSRGSFAAAEILADSFAGNEDACSQLLRALPIDRRGGRLFARPELAVALSVGWPESPLVDELYSQMIRGDSMYKDYTAYFEVTLSRCLAADLPGRLQRHFAVSGVVSNQYVSRALVRGLVRRLKRDPDAASALLAALNESVSASDKASIARSLASANGLSPELAGYCSREIRAQMALDCPDLGFDVVSGEIRGIALSLLDVLDGGRAGLSFQIESDS
ncbi:MAG: hypothetical protein ACREQR_01480 [Candidatus Binataceae bacterium]